MNYELSNEECEYIGKEKEDIIEHLKDAEHELEKMRPNISSIEDFKQKLMFMKWQKDDLDIIESKENDSKMKYE